MEHRVKVLKIGRVLPDHVKRLGAYFVKSIVGPQASDKLSDRASEPDGIRYIGSNSVSSGYAESKVLYFDSLTRGIDNLTIADSPLIRESAENSISAGRAQSISSLLKTS